MNLAAVLLGVDIPLQIPLYSSIPSEMDQVSDDQELQQPQSSAFQCAANTLAMANLNALASTVHASSSCTGPSAASSTPPGSMRAQASTSVESVSGEAANFDGFGPVITGKEFDHLASL